MYKIKYLKTGNTFLLPENEAEKLKNSFPEDYQILEKNGKKFKDITRKQPDNSVKSKVIEK